jgi:hypothetical protein
MKLAIERLNPQARELGSGNEVCSKIAFGGLAEWLMAQKRATRAS